MVCPVCGVDVVASNDSNEHIIPAAIGGRRTVRGFLHRSCNNLSGNTWDARLVEQLSFLVLRIGVKTQGSQALRMKIVSVTGEEFLIGPGGELTMMKPEIVHTTTPQGDQFQFIVGSKKKAREIVEGYKRKYPTIDVEETLATAQVRTSRQQRVLQQNLTFGGEETGRSLVKSALALAYKAGIRVDSCSDALSYLGDSSGEPCYGWYYADDLVAGRQPGVPLHCVAIRANPLTGLILGYIEYFGIYRAVVCLGSGYAGEAINSVYAIDPRTGKDLELAVRLDFDTFAIAAIYDGKMDVLTERKAAFDSVFAPVHNARRMAETRSSD